jgi:UrcA family protein
MNIRHARRLSFVLVAALVAAAPATAGPAQQVRISYSGLDLATPAGVATLYGRLRHATEVVCGAAPPARDLNQRPAWTACTTASLDDAVARSGLPALVAMHERQNASSVVRLAARR